MVARDRWGMVHERWSQPDEGFIPGSETASCMRSGNGLSARVPPGPTLPYVLSPGEQGRCVQKAYMHTGTTGTPMHMQLMVTGTNSLFPFGPTTE